MKLYPKLLYIAFLTPTSVRADNDITPLVWGDTTQAEPGQFPYYVQVFGKFTCGGSLVAKDVVATAAHCLGKKPNKKLIGKGKQMWVLVGALKYGKKTNNAKWHTVVDIAVHPKTSKWTLGNTNYDYFDYDYALLKINKPYNMKDSPVQFRLNMDANFPMIGDDLTLSGLGAGNFPNDPDFEPDGDNDDGGNVDYLHYATALYKYTNKDCNRKKKNGIKMWNGAITSRQMCWSERCWKELEVCPGAGDSGGPLVKIEGNIHTQVGLVSYGSNSGKKPDVLARVSKFCAFTKKWVCRKWKSMSPSEYLCASPCQ